MRTIVTIALKDLHLLWRDRIGFFWWIVGFPLMIAIFMGSIFGGVVGGRPRPIEIAVVDELFRRIGKDLTAVQSRIEESLEPHSFDLEGVRVRFATAPHYLRLRNVVAKLPGSARASMRCAAAF